MGNPHIEEAKQALRSAYAAGDTGTYDNAQAAVHAQLAIAYELNTIGRVLAQQAEIITPVANTKGAAADQHNTILSRLGV